MTPPQRSWKYIVVVFIVLFMPHRPSRGERQSTRQDETADKFLNAKVAEFHMHGQTLVDGLWELDRGAVAFAFGFEGVLKRKLTDPDVQDVRFDLDVKNKTVREIFDALCQADPRFTWSVDEATVNIYPRAIVNNHSYLLNRKLESFELKNATDVDDGLLAIAHQLPPPVEQVAHAQVGGDDPYPPVPWTVTYHNLTVRQVVNRLTLHGGPCGIWIFGGSADFRAFGFFNTCPGGKEPPPWIKKIIESRPTNP
jgi:hypothetical protein